nr:helitron helicase-like domain-containing protein [Tanacetum cinerariifolium]
MWKELGSASVEIDVIARAFTNHNHQSPSRLDLTELGIKPKLFDRKKEDKTTLPPTGYTLTNAEKDIFCETLSNIRVPQGYCSNFSSLVSLKDRKLIGLKSHDYHMLMQEFFPIAIRSIMHPPTRYAIIRRHKQVLKTKNLGKRIALLENEHSKSFAKWLREENTYEIVSYIERHKQVLKTKNLGKRIALLENEHSKSFAKWLREEVERELAISKDSVSETVRWISYGPRATIVKCEAYNINGYTFRTKSNDGIVYQNNGVSVEAVDLHISNEVATIRTTFYYGVLEEIWVLDYRFRQIPLFKYDWVNYKAGGVKHDPNLGYTLVDLNSLGHKDDSDEPEGFDIGKGIVEPDTGSLSWSEKQALSVVSEAIDACSWPLGAYSECSSAIVGCFDLADVCGFSQIAQQPSSFDGRSRSQPTATHVFTENLKRIVDSDIFDRYSELSSFNDTLSYLPLMVVHDLSPIKNSPGGQPVFTSAVNVTVHIHSVGDGLNEPARFSKQVVGVNSGLAGRNICSRFTPTKSVTQGSVSRLSTGSRQHKRTRGNASSVENIPPRRGTRGQRRTASISNNGGMLQDFMPGYVNELSTTVEQHPGATHIIRNPSIMDRTCVPMSRIFDRFRSLITFVLPYMSERAIGQPVSTSAVNVGMLVQPVGDGLNEPARFFEQGVDSGRANRNVRMQFTSTVSVMQESVSRLSTGSRQRKRTRGNARSVENILPRRGTRGQRSASISNNGGMLQDSMFGYVNELSTIIKQHLGATHIIRNPCMTDCTYALMWYLLLITFGLPNMSKRAIGQPVSTSAINVGMLVQPVGDGMNEPAQFSKQGVDSGRASRNVRRRFTPTDSVTQGSVSRLSTGSRQRRRTRRNASSNENTLPRRGTRSQRRSASVVHSLCCLPSFVYSKILNACTTPVYEDLGDCDQQCRYCGAAFCSLEPETVQGLIHFLDTHNELVQLFRIARDKCREIDVPEIKIWPYNGAGTRGYKLPASNTLGAIVFGSGHAGSTDFDIIIQERDGPAQRINKLHRSYMSLQWPLLFVYGQSGFHTELKLMSIDGSRTTKRVTMLVYYAYQLHLRHNHYNLIFKGGRLFQQYVVGLYDTISRGKREGHEVGGRIILPMSFTGGPRYMYAHYLDALAICQKLEDQSFHRFLKKVKDFWKCNRSFVPDLPDPNVDPRGYKIISEMMMHGPCRPVNLSAQCMEADKCTKNFLKKFTLHTFFDDKGHVRYQRRDTKIKIFNLIIDADAKNKQELIFVCRHDGTMVQDEAPMNDQCCFEALDRSLRHKLNTPLSLFGGKSIVLRGDFWQTLLVKKGASNMEVTGTYISVDERNLINSFALWLLDVGDGKIRDSDEEDPENASWIDIPYRYASPQVKKVY